MQSRRQSTYLSLFLFSLLFFSIILCDSSPSRAADIHVDDNTCPNQGSGIEADPYCTITDAVSAAVSGDRVLVHPGTYAERIIMKSNVDVVAAEAEKPVIRPSEKTLVKFNNDNCALDGFVLDASDSAIDLAIIIINDGCTDVTVNNCELKGADFPAGSSFRAGIKINGQVTAVITNNTIYNVSYAGITTKWGGTITDSHITIQGNIIYGCGTAGIYISGASGSSNRLNIGGNGYGEGNVIFNNGAGLDGKGSGIWLDKIDQASIANNTVHGNRRAGILLTDTDSASPHISGNFIYENGEAGINIGGASNLTIGSGNDIYSNGMAGITFFVFRNSLLRGWASSEPVLITGNSIHENTKAGIAVIDNLTGPVTIDNNEIFENTRSGIAFFASCNAIIMDNHIHNHGGAAGIFTGDWSGTYPPDPDNPPTTAQYFRATGPVNLTVRRNIIHDNRSGMRLDHASGIITNNLVYGNSRSGIRYSGNSVSPYYPFNIPWGITEISNNTVSDNGSFITEFNENRGGGIIYDDISVTIDPDTGNPRNFYDRPVWSDNQAPRIIINNIATWNIKAGIRDTICSNLRDYNLYYGNNGELTFVPVQTGGCAQAQEVQSGPPDFTGNPNEIFADPMFFDHAGGDYHLQAGSPAVGAGNDGNDMGAYGGSDPITW